MLDHFRKYNPKHFYNPLKIKLNFFKKAVKRLPYSFQISGWKINIDNDTFDFLLENMSAVYEE